MNRQRFALLRRGDRVTSTVLLRLHGRRHDTCDGYAYVHAGATGEVVRHGGHWVHVRFSRGKATAYPLDLS